ncbi:uncharacterized protein [Manis javanica]|uniref:uncharacterized protein n=1 Tax=Manis javanica TaxID=9974 RepID=UPI0018792135|nr:protein enabled-like [Manis javanica]
MPSPRAPPSRQQRPQPPHPAGAQSGDAWPAADRFPPPGARPGRLRALPDRPPGPPPPRDTGRGRPSPPLPRPGAHLLGSGFRRSSSLAAECGAAVAAATAAAAAEALPGAPPGLEAGPPRDPRRRGPGTRRGRAAGSCRREARIERAAGHRLPSSHNFAARGSHRLLTRIMNRKINGIRKTVSEQTSKENSKMEEFCFNDKHHLVAAGG